jgi:hypothetical protein
MDDSLPMAGARPGAGSAAGAAVARALVNLEAAPAPSAGTVGPLVTALAVALEQDATDGPYGAAETTLAGRMPDRDPSGLGPLMLVGAAAARALRWSRNQDAALWPGVRDLLDRAEAGLRAPEPTESWLAAGLPLFGVQLILTVRTGDTRTTAAAARLAGVLGRLLDRRPDLAAAMAGTVTASTGQVGMLGSGMAIREALRMLEQLLSLTASLPELPFAGLSFPGRPFPGGQEAAPMFVTSRRTEPGSLPAGPAGPADRVGDR